LICFSSALIDWIFWRSALL